MDDADADADANADADVDVDADVVDDAVADDADVDVVDDAVADDADVDDDDNTAADDDDDDEASKLKGKHSFKSAIKFWGMDGGDRFFTTWNLMLPFVVDVREGVPIVISLYRFVVPILNLLLKTRPSILVAIASHFFTFKVVPYLPFLYKPISSNNS